MKRTFEPKRIGIVLYLLIICVAIIVIPIIMIYYEQDRFPWIFLLFFLPLGLIVWALIDTSYIIEDEILKYRSGMVRGQLNIAEIRSISVGKTPYWGIRPALAIGGLFIEYKKYDKLYIAPSNQKEIIEALLKINGDIDVFYK